MSNDALTWAWQQETRSSGERLVLLALADHASQQDDDPPGELRCWPRVSRIAEMTKLSDSTIRGHLVALDERNLIRKAKRRRRRSGHLGSWEYTLDLRSTERPTADGSAVATVDRPTQASADRPARIEPEGENPKRSNERARPTDEQVTALSERLSMIDPESELARFWRPTICGDHAWGVFSFVRLRKHYPTLLGQLDREAGRANPAAGSSIVDRIDRVRKGDTP